MFLYVYQRTTSANDDDDDLSQATPDDRQTLLQFIDVVNLTSVANVSVHASVPKEDISAFNVTQSTQTIKFIWLILSTIRRNGDIVLDMSEICYYWYYVFHKVV